MKFIWLLPDFEVSQRITNVSHSVMSNSLDLMDYSPSGSSVDRILQARTLEWVAISYSRRSSPPRDQTCISCIAGGFFNTGILYHQGSPWGVTNKVQMGKAGSIGGFIKEDILLSALEQRARIPEMGKSIGSTCGRRISKWGKGLFFPAQEGRQ